jgi:hypothetical protein
MNIKNLYKQTCGFERRVLQLDTHDDTLSAMDWDKLSEKLATDEEDAEILLKPNERQLSHLVDEKHNWVIDINPILFLDMTTESLQHMQEILDEAAAIDVYKSLKHLTVHPSLTVDKETGQIEGHEGRHRAAAVHIAGGKWYRIGLKLRTESRNHGIQAMPWIWLGQFNGKRFDIKNLMAQNKIRVMDTTVQKDYWR